MGIQEEIKVIHVRLTSISVSSFSIQDETLTFEINFNDGSQKQVFRTTRVEDSQELAERILLDIIRMEENIHMEFDGESLVGNVHVIVHEFDSVLSSLSHLLQEAYGRLCRIKNAKASAGYIDMVRALQHTGIRFHG